MQTNIILLYYLHQEIWKFYKGEIIGGKRFASEHAIYRNHNNASFLKKLVTQISKVNKQVIKIFSGPVNLQRTFLNLVFSIATRSKRELETI